MLHVHKMGNIVHVVLYKFFNAVDAPFRKTLATARISHVERTRAVGMLAETMS